MQILKYIQRGDRRSRLSWKITTNIGFLAIVARIPRKISQHLMLGHHRRASEMPWRADNDLFLVVFGSSLHPSTEKTLSKLDSLWHNFLNPRMKFEKKNSMLWAHLTSECNIKILRNWIHVEGKSSHIYMLYGIFQLSYWKQKVSENDQGIPLHITDIPTAP